MKSLSKLSRTIIVLGCFLTVSNTAFAVILGPTGSVTGYHLNGGSATRDACIRMTPSINSPTGWGCLLKSNPLRAQISTTMREAFERGLRCRIFWDTTEPGSPGDAVITGFECGNYF